DRQGFVLPPRRAIFLPALGLIARRGYRSTSAKRKPAGGWSAEAEGGLFSRLRSASVGSDRLSGVELSTPSLPPRAWGDGGRFGALCGTKGQLTSTTDTRSRSGVTMVARQK